MQSTPLLKAFESTSPPYSSRSQERRQQPDRWTKLANSSPDTSRVYRITGAIGAIAAAAVKAISLVFLLIAVLIGTVGAVFVLLVLQINGKGISGFEHHFSRRRA
jgi:hypothetical protein